MTMPKFTEDQLQEIMYGNYVEALNEVGEYEELEYDLIEKSEWEDEGKFSTCEVVFFFQGKYYAFYPVREGSYWSGYETMIDTDLIEVQKEEYVSYRWVQKKYKESNPSEPPLPFKKG